MLFGTVSSSARLSPWNFSFFSARGAFPLCIIYLFIFMPLGTFWKTALVVLFTLCYTWWHFLLFYLFGAFKAINSAIKDTLSTNISLTLFGRFNPWHFLEHQLTPTNTCVALILMGFHIIKSVVSFFLRRLFGE